jgi:hypothetical protein
MKLNILKEHLGKLEDLQFQLPDNSMVPAHFHVTEVGRIIKDFIDCGGVRRHEEVANFQLWFADDTDHKLAPSKLIDIINKSQEQLGLGNLEVEVEYQNQTIGKYGLDISDNRFLLVNKHTDCLAKDNCGIPQEKLKLDLASLTNQGACTPGSGCC